MEEAMGLFDFLLKKNSKIGGTAEWVANTYKLIRNNNPTLGHIEILRCVNGARCSGYKDEFIINSLNGWVNNADSCRGLCYYVLNIIHIEHMAYCLQNKDHSGDVPEECEKIIIDILSKAGLEKNVI